MAPSVEAILKDYEHNLDLVERIAHRKITPSIEIVAPDPTWPAVFLQLKTRIIEALGDKALEVEHVGSTSVPGLPAKDVIDIDLVVSNITDEDTYVPQLEVLGFHFLIRERQWHQHRFFASSEPRFCNLHVWGRDCPEVERHRLFRDWLVAHSDDRLLYCEIKNVAARQTREGGGNLQDYNERKQDVIRQILRKIFKDLGYMSQLPADT
jgi:GrpB-like predicted nucleotidyltransferase (UPF0157 family)